MTVSRRRFLQGVGVAAGGAALGALPLGLAEPVRPSPARDAGPFRFDADADPMATFPQSVASGDPGPDGALLWTRVEPARHDPTAPLGVEVAEDADFERILHRGLVPGDAFGPATGHTVRVDLQGQLPPASRLWYRFVYRGTASRRGRVRTLPSEGARVERLRLAVLTCQNFQNGYFPALRHVADDDRLDFVVHLGDFIYEYGGACSYNGKCFDGRGIHLPSGAPRMESLEDLYYVWARYRSDPDLAAMLEAHTLIATWDDHEITNDRYFDYEERRHYGDDEFHLNGDKARLDAFFAAGLKAYVEWMPVRVHYDPAATDPLDRLRLHRSFRFGDLVELFMLDERWHRSVQPGALFEPSPEMVGDLGEVRMDAKGTMLGAPQLAWLRAGLADSRARWKVLGNPVMLAPLAVTVPGAPVYVNLDAWDGYEVERRKVVEALAAARNAVVLTGDLHSFMVGYVRKDFDAAVEPAADRVAVEFMTPAVTSANLGEILEQARVPPKRGDDEAWEAAVLAGNPHIVHWNSHRHGYSIVEFTREAARYEGYVVDKATPRAEGNRWLLAAFECPAGRYELRAVYRASPAGLPANPAPEAIKRLDPRANPLPGLPPAPLVVRDLGDLPAALRAAAGPLKAQPPLSP